MSVKMKFGSKDIPFVYKGDKLVYPNPIKDGLLLWYDFKGMRNTDVTKEVAKDLSGNGNDGTLTNFNFTEESGYKDNTLVFDGVDDSLTIPELELDETAMTVVHDGKLYAYEDDKVIKVKNYSEDTRAEIKGIEVGGRNYQRNITENYSKSPVYNTIEVISEHSLKITYAVEQASIPYVFLRDIEPLNTSEEYTLNFYVTLLNPIEEYERISLMHGIRDVYPDQNIIIESNKRKRITLTFTPSTEKGKMILFPRNYNKIDKPVFLIEDVMLTKGNTTTEWTPAPEDFQTNSLSPSSLSNLQLYNRPLRKDELLHNAESKGLKELVNGVVVQDGLVLHYDFSHESNTSEYKGKAFDYSGNGNHGVLQNFGYAEGSGYDEGLTFDGVDDYVQATQNIYENFTVEMVLRLKPFQKVGSIFGSRRSVSIDAEESGIEIRNDSNSSLRYYIADGTTISTNGVSAGIDMSEKMFHLLFTKGTDGGFITINGREVSRFSAQDIGTITDSRPLSLGTRGSSGTYGQNVEFSSFKFYNKALTPEEIAHNYTIEREKFNITEGEM